MKIHKKTNNLINKIFGKLKVLCITNKRLSGHVILKCICSCGNIAFISQNHLINGQTKSCGCLSSPNLIGLKFSKLMVIKKSNKRTKCGLKLWKCKCDCGKIVDVIGTNLKTGRKKSCGCSQYPRGKENPNWKHGLSKNKNYIKKMTKKSFLKRLGMTLNQYYLLLQKQNNKCAICGKPQKLNKKSLSVDHNHKTGMVRGLLCSNCNFMLGLAKDNVIILKKAIKYLKEV
jgi:hypothetical protein